MDLLWLLKGTGTPHRPFPPLRPLSHGASWAGSTVTPGPSQGVAAWGGDLGTLAEMLTKPSCPASHSSRQSQGSTQAAEDRRGTVVQARSHLTSCSVAPWSSRQLCPQLSSGTDGKNSNRAENVQYTFTWAIKQLAIIPWLSPNTTHTLTGHALPRVPVPQVPHRWWSQRSVSNPQCGPTVTPGGERGGMSTTPSLSSGTWSSQGLTWNQTLTHTWASHPAQRTTRVGNVTHCLHLNLWQSTYCQRSWALCSVLEWHSFAVRSQSSHHSTPKIRKAHRYLCSYRWQCKF